MSGVRATRWRRRDDVLVRRSLDAVVLLPVGAEDPLVVAGSGPAVWAALAEPGTVGELAGRLAGAFDADPAVVAADLEPLLERLAAIAAIEPVDQPPGHDAPGE